MGIFCSFCRERGERPEREDPERGPPERKKETLPRKEEQTLEETLSKQKLRKSEDRRELQESKTANKKEFVEQLKQKYKQWYESVPPLPYIRNNLCCVNKVFVEGGIQFYNRCWTRLDSYQTLFRQSTYHSRRRFIIGGPGYGKSTLTLQFSYDWCNLVTGSYLTEIDILIILRLRQVRGVQSINEAIRRFILPIRSSLTEHDVEIILKESQSVLVILDGFDEYPDVEELPWTDVMKISMSQMFQQFDVIITSRCVPLKCSRETIWFKLTGFDSAARKKYMLNVMDYTHAFDVEVEETLQKNPVLEDFCEVPLIFVMFVHLYNDNKKLKSAKTVTNVFRYIMEGLYSHMRNKMRDINVRKYYLHEENHEILDKVAFESLFKPQTMWEKQALQEILGGEFYDLYIRIGVLVEEEVNIESTYSEQQFKRNVRFYHRLFCEWFAAHHLVELSSSLHERELKERLCHVDYFEVQYLFRFACGLNKDFVNKISDLLGKIEGGKQLLVLCILERSGDLNDIREIVEGLCAVETTISEENSKLLQRATLQVLVIASESKIDITSVCLRDCFETALAEGGNYLQLKSSISMPALATLKQLLIQEEGMELSKNEFEAIIRYSLKCEQLKEVWFRFCVLPFYIPKAANIKGKIEVYWRPVSILLCLDSQSGFWKYSSGYGEGKITKHEYQRVVEKIKLSQHQPNKLIPKATL